MIDLKQTALNAACQLANADLDEMEPPIEITGGDPLVQGIVNTPPSGFGLKLGSMEGVQASLKPSHAFWLHRNYRAFPDNQ